MQNNDIPIAGFSRAQCVSFGNGTTALTAAIRSIGIKNKYIAVPSNVCPNIISAIFYTSNKPYFIDIELKRYGLDPELLKNIINSCSAVIAVHAYGMPCEIIKIRNVCDKHNVPLIEDCAQAEGANFENQQVGCFGDLSVFSTGAGKIIDVGGGGSLAVNNNEYHAGVIAYKNSIINKDKSSARELSQLYKEIYNNYYPRISNEQRNIFYRRLSALSGNMQIKDRPDLSSLINKEKQVLRKNIDTRIDNYNRFSTVFFGKEMVEVMEMKAGSVPWRFNIFINHELRQKVLKEMLNEGCRISSWFPDIARFLPADLYKSTSLINTNKIDKTILNFPVDNSSDLKEINAALEYISRAALEISIN